MEALTKAERDDPAVMEQAETRLFRVLEGGELAGDFIIHVKAKGSFEPISKHVRLRVI